MIEIYQNMCLEIIKRDEKQKKYTESIQKREKENERWETKKH